MANGLTILLKIETIKPTNNAAVDESSPRSTCPSGSGDPAQDESQYPINQLSLLSQPNGPDQHHSQAAGPKYLKILGPYQGCTKAIKRRFTRVLDRSMDKQKVL